MTATSKPIVTSKARELLGLYEHPDGSNHVPGITDWYGIDPGPWCAMFVSRVFYNAGYVEAIAFSTSRGFAYCPYGVNAAKRLGRWHQGADGITEGDVVFYDWNGDGIADHVEYAIASGFTTIGGNVGNRSQIVKRSSAGVMGYYRPAYTDAPHPAPVPPNDHPPAPGAPPFPGRDLFWIKSGPLMNDANVHTVQHQLEKWRIGAGATLSGTGPFGPHTDQAVRDFQRARHLTVDGVVGKYTWPALFRSS